MAKEMEKIYPVSVIEVLLDLREIVQTRTLQARSEIEYRQDEYNDISHLLEFGTFNAAQLCKFGKQLQESKQVRRECMNVNELLTPLYDYIEKNAGFFNGLEKIRIDIEKTKKAQAKRKYEIRVREDLREQLNKAQGE